MHGDRAVLPDSKTGPRTIWLASPVRAILAARTRCGNCPWVFAYANGRPVSLDTVWKRVRTAAGLDTLRLRVVAGLLGHADIGTTFGYAHLAEDSVTGAAHRISRSLSDMLDGGEADHD